MTCFRNIPYLCIWKPKAENTTREQRLRAIDKKHQEDGFNKEFMKKIFQRQGWKNDANSRRY